MWNSASPSQLKTYNDCNKKWYYNKILGLDIPSTASTDLGGLVHKYIEDILQDKKPSNDFEAMVANSMEYLTMIKTKNPQIELSFSFENLPVSVKGRIDLFWIEGKKGYVVDHKTTSNLKWALTEDVLVDDPQAVLYSGYIFDTYPEVDEVQFTLHYLTTKTPFKSKWVSVSYQRDTFASRLDVIKTSLEQMKITAAQEENKVKKNTDACFKFGPCPFRDRCLKFRGDLFEEIAMVDLGSILAPRKTEVPTTKEEAVSNTIYIGCRPVDKPFVMLEAFAEKEIAEFCEKEKLPHYTVDPYNKGPRVVAGMLWYAVKNKDKALPTNLVVDGLSPLGAAFITLLHESNLGANIVVNGVR